MKRIGFCCKYISDVSEVNGIGGASESRQYNTGTTTVSWLSKQSVSVAEDKLWELLRRNLAATQRLVERVGEQDANLRMVRLSSDILCCYTHRDWNWFWSQGCVRRYASEAFATIGRIARDNDIRLSFHPGQFCCLASDRPDVITNSIAEIEYHADMARWMGYGSGFHDHGFKINIHISGRGGIEQFKRSLALLSPVARNLITVENEEMTYGLDDCIAVSDAVPVVLDIHHHWVREGNYIDRRDDRVSRVIDSWRGIRPTLHYSVSRRDLLADHCSSTRPDHSLLLESGKNKQKLRAHSDFYWNTGLNDWALEFLEYFDIQCEAKGKNIASAELYKRAKELNIL